MNMSALYQLEQQISQLSLDEQLSLMKWLLRHIRRGTLAVQSQREAELLVMVNDPEIQRELRLISEKFAVAEADGLELVLGVSQMRLCSV